MNTLAGKSTVNTVIIGAGPLGIECSVNLTINHIDHVLLDAGALGNTILNWSNNTHFLSSADRLEIARIPLQNIDQLPPTGQSYLAYLRAIVEQFDLPLFTYHVVDLIEKGSNNTLEITGQYNSIPYAVKAKNVILAVGSMHMPRKLSIQGEDLPFVHSGLHDIHRFFRKKVLVIGDGNSALEFVIRTYRMGGSPSLLFPEASIDPDLVRVEYYREYHLLKEKKQIATYANGKLLEIKADGTCIIESKGKKTSETFDNVIKCIGYEFNTEPLKRFGIQFKKGKVPVYDKTTMESNVPNLFLAGTIAGGKKYMQEFFIGTCHHHVEKILKRLTKSPVIQTGSPAQRSYTFEYKDVKLKAVKKK